MDNNSKLIGMRINDALAFRQRKQKELAEYLQVKPNVISYFCKGERVPNVQQIIKISEFFNVSTDFLLGLSDNKTTDKDILNVCELTGLSENAVTELIKNKTLSSNQLSKIMEKSEFWNIIRVFARAQSDVKSYYPNSEETINAVVDSLFCPEIPYKYKKAFEFISINGTHQLYKNELSSLITELLDKIVKEEIKNGEHNSQKE